MNLDRERIDVVTGRKSDADRLYEEREAALYDRDSLQPGFKANGPALIEEYGSTTLVWPQDSFEIGKLREIRISVSGG